MKKKIIVWAFLLLMVVTAVFCICEAVKSYRYDMDPANGVDILEGLGAVLVLIAGAFLVLYEADLFFTVYYFCFGTKTAVKTVLNLLASLSLVLIFGYVRLSDVFEGLKAYEITPFLLFLGYVGLRMAYFTVWFILYTREEGE